MHCSRCIRGLQGYIHFRLFVHHSRHWSHSICLPLLCVKSQTQQKPCEELGMVFSACFISRENYYKYVGLWGIGKQRLTSSIDSCTFMFKLPTILVPPTTSSSIYTDKCNCVTNLMSNLIVGCYPNTWVWMHHRKCLKGTTWLHTSQTLHSLLRHGSHSPLFVVLEFTLFN